MWYENEAWQNKKIFNDSYYEVMMKKYLAYYKKKPSGKSKGVRKP